MLQIKKRREICVSKTALKWSVIFTAIWVAACSEKPAPPSAPKPQVAGNVVTFPAGSPQLAVLTIAPVQDAADTVLELTARLTWDEDRTVRVYPPFAGRVTRIAAQPGDVVKAGQALAFIASPDFGQAQADVGRANADAALAEKNFARVKELFDNGVAPRKDLALAEADQARAASELARARARVNLYGGGAGVDQTVALKTSIAGTVVERNLNPGQELRTDQSGSAALFVVTDPKRLWVQIDAHEQDLPALAKGGKFKLKSPALPGESFEGMLDQVADFIDPQSRVIRARGSLDNSARKLKGEMLVTVEFSQAAIKAVTVPARAVVFTEGKHYAFVERGPGKFERVIVVAGAERRGALAVLSGLEGKQRIVTEGVLLLLQVMKSGGSKSEE
jgi:membrane fusion protein, heavy metal efflux system